jgi:hypothetical protein
MTSVTEYFQELNSAIGAGWNRFWFTPASARTLGAIRIVAGLLALYAVATYGPDLERFFGSDGMLPMSLVESLYRPEGQLLGQRSLLDFLPDGLLRPMYFASLAVISIYTMGIGGRALAIAAAVVTISFFARAPLLIGEFEAILSFLLVYLCIGRSTDALSVRGLLTRKTEAPASPHLSASTLSPAALPQASPLNTMALRLIQIHIVIVHLMMGLAQLSAPESAWWSGEGIWLAAGRAGMPYIDLSGLEEHPRVIAAWSHAITLYLLAAPVLLWVPLARPLMLAAGIAVWGSVALATGWAPFSLAILAGLGAFIGSPRKRAAMHVSA